MDNDEWKKLERLLDLRLQPIDKAVESIESSLKNLPCPQHNVELEKIKQSLEHAYVQKQEIKDLERIARDVEKQSTEKKANWWQLWMAGIATLWVVLQIIDRLVR